MRVLVFHGYLLGGTGSNVYNASLARTLRRLGHEVHLLCQDASAARLDWVDAVGDWQGGELRVTPTEAPAGDGSVTVYRPDIGGLLPVFVRDEYAGFRVKTFGELTDAELDDYVTRNVAAVRDVTDRAGPFDAALANHLVLSPVILARAGVPYALKVHGSDLAYTVLPDLERFGPYAREGARAARGILVGSAHIAARLRAAVDEPQVAAKVRLGPPGVDTDLFAPVPADAAGPTLRALAARLRAQRGGAAEAWERDPAEAAAAVEWLAASPGARVAFVGKLIVSKGADLLLAAWPLVRAASPQARLLIVGFGAYRGALEDLWRALTTRDIDVARRIVARGRALEGGEQRPLRHLAAFLDSPPAGYLDSAASARDSVRFAGRLGHAEVGDLVSCCDALVFPSTFPEAFGMVAAEAAAAGVLPVSAAHSGALEVSRELAAALPPQAAPLVSFSVDDRAVTAIAERLRAWLALDEAVREEARRALRRTSARLWGWDAVARGVIAASRGELDALPEVPTT